MVRGHESDRVPGRERPRSETRPVTVTQTTARKLGLPRAPKATTKPGQAVIVGHALLVATRSGHAAVPITFTRAAASKLRRARRVPVTVALTVVDSQGHSATLTRAAVLHD